MIPTFHLLNPRLCLPASVTSSSPYSIQSLISASFRLKDGREFIF